jgi:hypothetical protein
LPPTITPSAECTNLQAKFDRSLKVLNGRVAKKQAPDLAMVSAFLDTVVKPMPAGGTPGGCGKCVWSREGGVFDGVFVSAKEFNMNHTDYGGCDDYAHGTSVQRLYVRVQAEFPNGTAKELKRFVREHMEALGAVMLGKSENEKAAEAQRNPVKSKRKSENGVALYQYLSGQRERVDVQGALCAGTFPHHHCVFQGYQMHPAAAGAAAEAAVVGAGSAASRKRPMSETAVDSDSVDSGSD